MVDQYTKAVLTVIAACLVILVIRGLGGSANAQQTQHVYIDGASPNALQVAGPMHVICNNCRH